MKYWRMDGTEAEVLLDFDLQWPNSLTFDPASSTLYWCDTFLNRWGEKLGLCSAVDPCPLDSVYIFLALPDPDPDFDADHCVKNLQFFFYFLKFSFYIFPQIILVHFFIFILFISLDQ